MSELYSNFEIFGVPALFTDMPCAYLPPTPTELYRYDLRHGDDDSYPCTLERRVVVNRFGTVYVVVPLLSDDEDCRPVDEDDWSFCYDEEDLTIPEFIQKHFPFN